MGSILTPGPSCRWLLRNGADLMWAGRHPVSRDGERDYNLHLTDLLHMTCTKEGGAQLVAALVRAGAQVECERPFRSTGDSRIYTLEGTPLVKAAFFARYDSVQELVWQGASLKAPCAAEYSSMSLWDTTAGAPCHDAALAAMLHQSMYRWVHFFSLLSVLSPLCAQTVH